MSQYYKASDVVLWNPSMGASQLFIGQVRLFEAEFGLLSGVGLMESDECQIDLSSFDRFAQTLAAASRLRHHEVLRTLAEGFVVTVLAIAHSADLGASWPPPSDALETDFRERARNLEPSLAR